VRSTTSSLHPRSAREVPGLYVAGDASCDLSLAIVAAADGTTAAAALHRFLQRQEGLAD
jgi:thioredoxin reductase